VIKFAARYRAFHVVARARGGGAGPWLVHVPLARETLPIGGTGNSWPTAGYSWPPSFSAHGQPSGCELASRRHGAGVKLYLRAYTNGRGAHVCHHVPSGHEVTELSNIKVKECAFLVFLVDGASFDTTPGAFPMVDKPILQLLWTKASGLKQRSSLSLVWIRIHHMRPTVTDGVSLVCEV